MDVGVINIPSINYMSFWSETLVACPLDLFPPPPLSMGQHNLPLRIHTTLGVLFMSYIYIYMYVFAWARVCIN